MTYLSQVTSAKQVSPPRIIIYGTPKIGKTTFASESENPIILDLEGGSGNIEVPRISKDILGSFDKIMDALRALYKEQHDYKTVVIDSIDWLERIVCAEIAAEYNARSIDDSKVPALGFGKGYTLAITKMKQLTNALDMLIANRNMTIILICHEEIKSFENPEYDAFVYYDLKLHKKIGKLFTEWSDCILFAKRKIYTTAKEQGFGKRVTKGHAGDRVICTGNSASCVAGNRYELPEELPLNFAAFWKAFKEATKTKQETTAPKVPKAPKVARTNSIPTMSPSMGIPPIDYTKINGSISSADFLDI